MERRRVTIYFDEDVHDELKLRGIQERAKVNTLVEQAVEEFSHGRKPDVFNPKNQRWHEMLEAVLNSGHKDAVIAVKSNLIVFAEVSGSDDKSTAIPVETKRRPRKAG